MRNIGRLWRTLRDLKPVMIWARITLRWQKRVFRFRALDNAAKSCAENHPKVCFQRLPEADVLRPEERVFNLLNQEYPFENFPDWNFRDYGLLWHYRLNGFGWLEAFETENEEVNAIVQSRAMWQAATAIDALHPAALRLENGIRYYLSAPAVRTPDVLKMLWQDYDANLRLPEKHLDGNHLLQSYLAAFQGSIFFGEKAQQKQTAQALYQELNRQFLRDGCHYERSISYTAVLLTSLVKTLHLIGFLAPDGFADLVQELKSILQRGISFLETVAFSDGSFPAFGDSHTHLSPRLESLKSAIAAFSIPAEKGILRESGIRKMENPFLELAVQCGSTMPAFQPGHSHADTGSFCLHGNGKPFITDTGISTYNRNERRHHERSSAAHNVLVINGSNSSEVWAAFRVGRKAKVSILEDDAEHLSFTHNGYRHFGKKVLRTFSMREDELLITDKISGKKASSKVYFHLHPDILIKKISVDTVLFSNGMCMMVAGAAQIRTVSYEWCAGFNLRRPAACLVIVPAANHLHTLFRKHLSA